MPKSITNSKELKDTGSRDHARALLRQCQHKILEAIKEVNKLREARPRRVEYRYADVYLGQATLNVELAKIVLRKRKRKEEEPKAPVERATEAPTPIGEEE